MAPHRLDESTLAGQIAGAPDDLVRLALDLRDLILETAPAVDEAVKFGALSYFKPDYPFGSIGGAVCMLDVRDDCVRLGFLHGASLPDPEGLLQGSAKAKRYVEIRRNDWKPALRALIRAAVAFCPGE